MITSTAEPRYRGGFLSVNAAVQQFGASLATLIGAGLMGNSRSDEPLTDYWVVGLIGAGAGLVSLYLAGLVRPASPAEAPPTDPEPEGVEFEPVAAVAPR